MSNYVDYKVEIWRRAKFDDSANMNKIKKIIKETNSIEDIFDTELGFVEDNFIYDTEVLLAPQDNKACSTIEVYKNNQTIYKNSI